MNAHPQRGFSLVELMVAMGLSLILMAGALSILYSSKITYNENDRIARLQEAGRAAVELILRDARGVGYPGCARPNSGAFFNKLNDSNTLLWDFGQPVFGFNATGSNWSPGMDPLVVSPLAGSDVLVLRGARQGQALFRTTVPVAPADPITTTSSTSATLATGTPVVISDCEGSTVFAATGYASGTGIISHAAGTSSTLIATNTDNSLEQTFQIAAQVIPVQTTIYYVRDSTSLVGPALWRKVGGNAPEVLIEGVENMQLLYGEDTDSDLQVDRYIAADAVIDWNKVVSISIALLIRSEDETGLERDVRQYTLLDAAPLGPFNDRRQRSVFITTVSLRNVGT